MADEGNGEGDLWDSSLDEKPTFGRDITPTDMGESDLPEDILREHQSIWLEPGRVIDGRFEIIERLGFGGMGAVYKVSDRVMYGQVKALKVMLPSLVLSKSARERFISEVQVAQQLSHPNIVRVYDLGEDSGLHYFTMEYVEGQTLNRYLNERDGKIPVAEALQIIDRICAGLAYAHRVTVHRDLKPQNIMLHSDGTIKIMDFGLAKVMSPGRMTRSSMALGTAYYQAPEQTMAASKVDARADIYSLGVILYQMLTGKVPTGRAKSARDWNPHVSKALDTVVDRLLQMDPEDRPESVAEVRRMLNETRRAKRGRTIVFGTALVVLIGLLAAVGLWAYLQQVQTQREAVAAQTVAEQSRDTAGDVHADAKNIFDQGEQAFREGKGYFQNRDFKAAVLAFNRSVRLYTLAKTKTDMILARDETEQARSAAEKADAATKAGKLFSEAVTQFEEAQEHEKNELFENALGLYRLSAAKFRQAEGKARLAAAREAAETARASAQSAKADIQVTENYAEATNAFQVAERYERVQDFAKAASEYDNARSLFAKAEQAANALLVELNKAKSGTNKAKGNADNQDAGKYASSLYKQAEGARQSAENEKLWVKAIKLFGQATELYRKAADAARSAKEEKERQRAVADSTLEKTRQAQANARALKPWKYTDAKDSWSRAEETLASGLKKYKNEQYVAATTDFGTARILYNRAAGEAIRERPKPGDVIQDAPYAPKIVCIPSGTFLMGSPSAEKGRGDDEGPQHEVAVGEFFLGKYEVTVSEFRAFVVDKRYQTDAEKGAGALVSINGEWGWIRNANWKNPGFSQSDEHPVTCVSWNDASAYCEWLSEKTGENYRLPTEAEWEYACRAGSTTRFWWGDSDASTYSRANSNADDGYETTSPVGVFGGNPFGLCDMSGNVLEWCVDWYKKDVYKESREDNPQGAQSGVKRVLRGGSWARGPADLRSATRAAFEPDTARSFVGFRVARDP